jgi:hypothetical protein
VKSKKVFKVIPAIAASVGAKLWYNKLAI